MLQERITQDMKAALKAANAPRRDTLRFVLAQIQSRAKEERKEMLDDATVVAVLQREAKRRQEAIALYEKAGRKDLALPEQEQLSIVQEYLPAQLEEGAIAMIVDEVIGRGMKEFGAVMREVVSRTKGQADGALVSRIVREKLGA